MAMHEKKSLGQEGQAFQTRCRVTLGQSAPAKCGQGVREGKGESSMCGEWVKSDREWMMACVLLWTVLFGVLQAHAAETKTGKAFHAVVIDAQGVETDLTNVVFYWEEKVSETSFVPHEVRHLPAKRGTSNVNIKFETIAHIDVKQGAEKDAMTLMVTLTSGKKGDFLPAVTGTLRGESDFGQVDVPMSAISKIVFK